MNAEMHTMPQSAFGPDLSDTRGLNRMITWSVVVHLLLVGLVVVLPREWFGRQEPKREVMTITLGGTPGPRSTGTNSLGGRTVEQVAPPPRRPEPVRPTPPVEPTPAPPTRTPPRAETPRPAPTTKPAPPPTRAPVTGAQVSQGSTKIDTGAVGQGTGLTFGGGGTGGVTDLSNFCCPAYLEHLLSTINRNWRSNQPERRGTATLRFTIRRDGTIDLPNVVVEKSSGSSLLDRAARAALIDSNGDLLALPSQYTEPVLIVHLNFPYGS
jgi:outer membrane biosynthesis protein TonB